MASKWQPIESAPRDGTPIVVAAFVDGKWLFRVDYWRKYRLDNAEGFGWFAVSPTHWTVLPPLPPAPGATP